MPHPASPRITPLAPPFPDEIRQSLERIMPQGVPPLTLFTTLARNPRVFARVMAGGLLDRGSLSLRERELAIGRTCALCGCEYEWGVHIALFGARVGFGEAECRALVEAGAEAACWSEAERLILRLMESLHAEARIPEALWQALEARFSAAQLIELIVLAGLYHMISFLANGLALAPEAYAPRFPARMAPGPAGR